MIQVPKDKMHCIAPLFSASDHTLIRSCLEGCMGDAWADRLEAPTAAKICTTDFCFLSGNPDSPVAEELAAVLPDGYSHPWCYIIPLQTIWEPVIEHVHTGKQFPVQRYSLCKEATAFHLDTLQRQAVTPQGNYRISPFDLSTYLTSQKEEWSSHLCAWFPTYSAFQEHGIGIAAYDGNQLVCGATSHSYYKGGIEVEIDTKPSYRRKGLATACAATLILECIQRGLYPSWDAANRESLSLAQKLGYHFHREYKAYRVSTSV